MRGTSATPSTKVAMATARPVDEARASGSHTAGTGPRSGVFIAYSHRDRDLLGELQVHLKPLQKAWMLDLWDDLRVDVGLRGEQELQRAVAATRVAVLLVSPGLLTSPFVTGHALPVMDVFAEFRFVDPRTQEPRSVRITNFYGLNDPLRPLAALDKPARHQVLQLAAEEIIKAAHRNTAVATAQ
jgi:hypothetical protein